MLVASSAGAAVCYVVAATSAVPVVSLVACALCGLFVALLWPGTFSLTAARFPLGGGAMFALLALAGDAGGAAGPWTAGEIVAPVRRDYRVCRYAMGANRSRRGREALCSTPWISVPT